MIAFSVYEVKIGHRQNAVKEPVSRTIELSYGSDISTNLHTILFIFSEVNWH